jgi:ABC-type proline/glycine betaine transport system permease subunit
MLGVPVGIWCARNKLVGMLVRPVLDFMQTMPAFVYLIPAAMFFGLGRVPGILATVVFAVPPAVRLTSLGIRMVNKEQVEAGNAFGCTSWQLLFKVQLPIALPSIMAGVNQTIMMALSMVIIASMVGAGGLGNDVLASIQRLDVGLGFESGLAVVLLAIIWTASPRVWPHAHHACGRAGQLDPAGISRPDGKHHPADARQHKNHPSHITYRGHHGSATNRFVVAYWFPAAGQVFHDCVFQCRGTAAHGQLPVAQKLYRWSLLSADGQPVAASNGLELSPITAPKPRSNTTC